MTQCAGRLSRRTARVRRTFARAAALLSPLLAALAACAGATQADAEIAVRVEAADIEQAQLAHAEIVARFPPYDSPAVQRYVRAVGARVAAQAPRTNVGLRFTVLDTPGMFAYSLADGEVLVGRGLLLYLNSEAQLAAVLAHEIGHVVSLHQARQWRAARRARELELKLGQRFAGAQARDALGALSLARIRGYSRELEIEADIWSERLLARAGYDTAAVAQVLRFFVQQEEYWDRVGYELWQLPEAGESRGVFSTHPSPAARLQQALARRATATPGASVEPDQAYLGMLEGMIYGLPERYGVLRGRRYVHPSRGIGLTLPPDWYVFGADERLVAAPRTHEGLVFIAMEARAHGTPTRRALEALARGQSLKSVERIVAGSSRGETAVVALDAESESRPARLAVADIGEQRCTAVAVAFTRERWNEWDAQVRKLLASLHAVPPAQARAARPPRVTIERARSGGNAFAGQPFPDHARERWELLNQLYPGRTPLAGSPIKTIR